MPAPTGQIGLSDVNIELGLASTTTISINQTNVRGLAGVASGAIGMGNLRGKSNAFIFNKTISSNSQNYNLLNDMVANGYVNGSSYVANITINSGVYVWSDNTSLAGFSTGAIVGSGTINLINNGFIIGRGGNGGTAIGTQNGENGGPAISLSAAINIQNYGYIAGGGGGGGSGRNAAGGGGGAGGGSGGGAGGTGGGSGGSLGSIGSQPQTWVGRGGGRILPGINANEAGGLSGSEFFTIPENTRIFASGGGGGGWGASGGAGGTIQRPSPLGPMAGGTVNNPGSTFVANAGAGGAGGKAINLNGNTVTWNVFGTVYGAVS